VPAAPAIASNPVTIHEAGTSLVGMQVYPVPFKPSSGRVLRFRRMPPFSKVTLFTIVGETVIDMNADANGYVEWDGKNRTGTGVVPAVYIFMAKSPDGKKKIGKIQVAL